MHSIIMPIEPTHESPQYRVRITITRDKREPTSTRQAPSEPNPGSQPTLAAQAAPCGRPWPQCGQPFHWLRDPSLRPKRALGGLVLAEWGCLTTLTGSLRPDFQRAGPAPVPRVRVWDPRRLELSRFAPPSSGPVNPRECCVAGRRSFSHKQKHSPKTHNLSLFCILPPLFDHPKTKPSPACLDPARSQTLPSAALRAGRSM